jgi:hypothetical protein
MRTPYALRRYLLDSRPVTWWDLDPVNESEVMSEIDALDVGESVTLGMCSDVERLPDAPFGYVLTQAPATWNRRFRISCVGPDDVGAATGLEVDDAITDDERAQVYAATSLDELRALPFVVG